MQPCRSDDMLDYFLGTKDALVAAGLAPAELFPGEPGLPKCSVTLMPKGAPTGNGRVCTPGRLTLRRRAKGQFLAELVPVADELAKRRARVATERETPAAAGGEALKTAIQLLGHAEVLHRVQGYINVIHGVAPVPRRDGRPSRDCSHLRLVWSAA